MFSKEIGDLTFRVAAGRLVIEQRESRLRKETVFDAALADVESVEAARTRPTDGEVRRLPWGKPRYRNARSQTGMVFRLRDGHRRYFVVLGRPEHVLRTLEPLVAEIRKAGGVLIV